MTVNWPNYKCRDLCACLYGTHGEDNEFWYTEAVIQIAESLKNFKIFVHDKTSQH